MNNKGCFIISLDFEMNWGVFDINSDKHLNDRILESRRVIPEMLTLFNKYDIHATWATVGLLFFENKEEMIKGIPLKKPNYINETFSPYKLIYDIGEDENDDKLHYAKSIINKILQYDNQEIGCHTFVHYYCLEKGQDIEEFNQDLDAAICIAKKCGIELKSFVFPKNQMNCEYLRVCNEKGISNYRGNPNTWVYKFDGEHDKFKIFRRALRLIDTYVNISSYNSYSLKDIQLNKSFDIPFNIPASRYFRPYSKLDKMLYRLKVKRITSSMTHAAKNGQTYHLWWHPHDFGINVQENLRMLIDILEHFKKLQKSYNMKSLNMGELAEIMIKKQGL